MKCGIVSGPNRRSLGLAFFGNDRRVPFVVEMDGTGERISVQVRIARAKVTASLNGRRHEFELVGNYLTEGSEIPRPFDGLYRLVRDKHSPKWLGSCNLGE